MESLNNPFLMETFFPDLYNLFSQDVKDRLYNEIFIKSNKSQDIYYQYLYEYDEIIQYAKLRNAQSKIPMSQSYIDLGNQQISSCSQNLKYILFHMMVNSYLAHRYDDALILVDMILKMLINATQHEITLWNNMRITILNAQFDVLQTQEKIKIFNILKE